MRSLYFECETGISGDMIAASLLDLGADREKLLRVLEQIKDIGFSVEISRVMKSGIDCCDFKVVTDKKHENHDHDMKYLYDFGYGHHGHEHEHHLEHHERHEHHHEHEHRALGDVIKIIDGIDMPEGAAALAKRTFYILAEAEAAAHAKDINEVHFHEVGAVDSIADIIAASVCFDDLKIDEVIITRICEGYGSVRCQHGIIPVPVPAVLNIAEKYRLPISVTDRKGELITPTGAAFAAAVMTSNILPETFYPLKTGMGAGKRKYKQPSILRAILFERKPDGNDCVWKLETNIDDSTGEQLGYVMERLKTEGARDVFYTPVFMKKNRPAWLLSVITTEDKIETLEDVIFNETTTIGIRRQKMRRTVLPRRFETVSTKYGDTVLKICIHAGREKVYPEYESVSKNALENKVSFSDVYTEAVNVYNQRA